MTGREPMNAKNSQYALGGTLTGWTRLEELTARQARILKRSYQGLNPWVYGRYGHRQWLAPLPWVSCIVKDPFALASVPSIVAATGAQVVAVYRHPAAVLASWRRMGWAATPEDVAWAEALVDTSSIGPPAGDDTPGLVVRIWRALHLVLLEDRACGTPVRIIAHEEVSLGGVQALGEVSAALGLRRLHSASNTFEPAGQVAAGRLHNLNRDPRAVAHAWKQQVDREECVRLDRAAAPILQQLQEARLRLPSGIPPEPDPT